MPERAGRRAGVQGPVVAGHVVLNIGPSVVPGAGGSAEGIGVTTVIEATNVPPVDGGNDVRLPPVGFTTNTLQASFTLPGAPRSRQGGAERGLRGPSGRSRTSPW